MCKLYQQVRLNEPFDGGCLWTVGEGSVMGQKSCGKKKKPKLKPHKKGGGGGRAL